jgi:two-component SAPR family response regulator
LSPDSSPTPVYGSRTPATGSPTPSSGSPVPSAIHIFGPFEVSDKEGHDITRLFTPLLKELFLVITIYTIRNGKGISSEGLNEILWHDKAEKDAKNNRSVNLVKLKIILEKIGNCVISKESGCWQLQIQDPNIFVDYRKFVSLVQGTPDMDNGFIHQLLDIIKRGPFLFQTDYNWLDDIKSEISNIIIDRCLGYIRSHGAGENPEFIIEITNCIFYFDHLNEDALTIKCKNLILLKRHTLASNTYQKFVKDYKDIYGSDLGKSFQEIIS